MGYTQLDQYKTSKDLNTSKKKLGNFYYAFKDLVDGPDCKELFLYAIEMLNNPYFKYIFADSFLLYLRKKFPTGKFTWLQTMRLEYKEASKHLAPKPFKIKTGNIFANAKRSANHSSPSFDNNKSLHGRPISIGKRN